MNHRAHRRLRRSLDAFVDGELDAGQALVMSRHIDECPGCGDLERRIQRMKRALRRTGDRRTSQAVVDRLREFGRTITAGPTG